MSEDKPKSRRGFASMSKERLAEVSRSGGAAVPPDKRSFFKDRTVAAMAGSKGGTAKRKAREKADAEK